MKIKINYLKRHISFVLVLVLTLCLSLNLGITTLADENSKISIPDFSVVLSEQDLEDGVTVVLYKNEDGSFTSKQIFDSSDYPIMPLEGPDGSLEWATFHVSLYNWINDTGKVSYTITCDEPLNTVRGNVYVETVDKLIATTFFSKYIRDSCHGATRRVAEIGTTKSMKGYNSVLVRFSSITFTTIGDEGGSFPNAKKEVFKN